MDKDEELMYDLLGSPLKKLILNELSLGKPKTAMGIKKDSGAIRSKLSRPSISRALGVLKNKGLVKCSNESHHRYRFYAITEKGKKIQEKIKDID